MKKQIDHLTHIFAKSNKGVTKSTSSSNQESTKKRVKGYADKGKALCTSRSIGSGRYLLDSGASHHMASS